MGKSFAEVFCDLSLGEIYKPELYVPEPKRLVTKGLEGVKVNKHFSGSASHDADRAKFEARREAANTERQKLAQQTMNATAEATRSSVEGPHGKSLSWQEARIAEELSRRYSGREAEMRRNVGGGYPKGGQDPMQAIRDVSRGFGYS